jgi:hypothetical protein
MKRVILAVLAVFVAWQVLDFVIHGLILMGAYQESAQANAGLWRPMNEMKFSLMRLVALVAATTFVVIYAGFIHEKSVANGLKYGLIFGVGAGVSMGLGTYSVMPIPAVVALGWLVGAVVESAVGGLLVGWIVKGSPSTASPA